MDLVYKRYTNPFFLDYAIENNSLDEFIDMLLKKKDEEMLWELYLATIPYNQKDFNEWKKEALNNNQKKETMSMTKKEIDATIKKSQNILSGFKPPQEGGKFKC